MMSVHKIVHCLLAPAVWCGLSYSAGITAVVAASAEPASHGRDQMDKALVDIRHNMALAQQRAATLAEEVKNLQKDQKTLAQALVKAARAEREYGQNIRVSECKLKMLAEKQHAAKAALERRRAEFSEVLAGLERMGLHPPPAILVRSDDALQSVRSAVLLGALVPQMKARTDALNADLRELETITKSVSYERMRLANAMESQQIEKKRLSLLMAEKARLQKQSETNLSAEKDYSRALSEKAKSLQDLLAGLQRPAPIAKDDGSRAGAQLLQMQADIGRLRGLLPLPVDGRRVQVFGKSSQGETIETEPGAVVLSPVEGIVRYAGAFRSYGQLLIIDSGHNYHFILAGLGRIDVAQGQMLLQGEPVGVMGAPQLVASTGAFDIGKSAAMLYIELRKNGKPVNPAPWWARR